MIYIFQLMREVEAWYALALDVVLVTNNTKEFERVPALQLENWVP